ncbi:hypothetical protein K438DRAFT_1758779 [Mycena galopus ATCC 62051]|nr:hypothetical protein K438DRAFT_1758779 [Mycena galopus ATCC 62051]
MYNTIREEGYRGGRKERMLKRDVRNGRKARESEISLSAKNDGDKRKPHPDDDEQLQDGEEQPRAAHSHADAAWRHRARVEIVPGEIEGIAMKRGVKSELSRPSVYAPSHSSDVHPASDGQGRGKARSIRRKQMRVENRKPPEAGMARAQTPDGTPAQRVEHVKEGWGDVRASKAKRGTATHDLRVRPSYMYGLGRREQRTWRERPDGAGVPEDKPRVVVIVVLRLGFGRAFVRSVAMLVELCSAWCALRLWVVMMEEEVAQGPVNRGLSNGGKAQWACAEEQGEKRGRTDEGQDYEGKLDAGGGGGRWRRAKSYARRVRWRNEGGVHHGLVEKFGGRCERAREGGSRAARDGEEGGMLGDRESRVQIVRIHSRQDTHARSASKECHLACVLHREINVRVGEKRDGRTASSMHPSSLASFRHASSSSRRTFSMVSWRYGWFVVRDVKHPRRRLWWAEEGAACLVAIMIGAETGSKLNQTGNKPGPGMKSTERVFWELLDHDPLIENSTADRTAPSRVSTEAALLTEQW